jgi:hypothetical protein
MIYTGSTSQDFNNLATYINGFTKAIKINNVQVDDNALESVCFHMVEEFPHGDGLEKASTFKKLANFMAYFICLAPVKTTIPIYVRGIQHRNINAVLALEIAIVCLENSKIIQQDGTDKKVDRPIYISDHSYGDIVDALSDKGICPEHHYKLITVLLEQIVYKTNDHCEYKPDNTDATAQPNKGFYEKPALMSEDDYQWAHEKWGDEQILGN